jgi:hypothetical protein
MSYDRKRSLIWVSSLTIKKKKWSDQHNKLARKRSSSRKLRAAKTSVEGSTMQW